MNSLTKLQDERILVIGDIMLDRFWWGEVTRISPEAPVPVVRLERTSEALGGAANVAANIAGLGSTPILIGCIGNEADGSSILGLLEESNIDTHSIVRSDHRPTTVKTRIVARGQHVVRVDKENEESVEPKVESEIVERITEVIGTVKCVVISDYAKGVLSDEILRATFGKAKEAGVPILVDPKSRDLTKYRGANLLTPNRREAAIACGLSLSSEDVVSRSGENLLQSLEGASVLITEGENGMTLFERNTQPFHVATAAREVFDVTGAGDTVIASLSVAIANGSTLRDAVELANQAAGLAVEHMGTTRVTIEMLNASPTREAAETA